MPLPVSPPKAPKAQLVKEQQSDSEMDSSFVTWPFAVCIAGAGRGGFQFHGSRAERAARRLAANIARRAVKREDVGRLGVEPLQIDWTT